MVCLSKHVSIFWLPQGQVAKQLASRTADCYPFSTNPPFRLPPAYTEQWSEPSWCSLGRIAFVWKHDCICKRNLYSDNVFCRWHKRMLGSADVSLISYHIHVYDCGQMAPFWSIRQSSMYSFLLSLNLSCPVVKSWWCSKIFPLLFLPPSVDVLCPLIFQSCHHLQKSKLRDDLLLFVSIHFYFYFTV